MDPLGFNHQVGEKAFNNAFQTTTITTQAQTSKLEEYLAQLRDYLAQYLAHELGQHQCIKVYPILYGIYEKPLGHEVQPTIVGLSCKQMKIHHQSDILGEIDSFSKEVMTRNENILRNQSLMNLTEISRLELNLADYNPIRTAGSFVELPKFLSNKHCIINVQNSDNRCFGYAVLAAMRSRDNLAIPQRPNHYNAYFAKYGLDTLRYPVDIADITDIEKKLSIAINIYSFYDDEGRARYPVHVSQQTSNMNIDLLHWSGHYAWIKDFSAFMYDINKHHGKKFFCHKCLSFSPDEVSAAVHFKNCVPKEGLQQVITLPVDPLPLKFKNFKYQQRCPFIVVADFECLTAPTNKTATVAHPTYEYQHHIPCSVGLKLISTVPQLANMPYKVRHGQDCTEWFLREVIALEQLCLEWLFKDERMIFTPADRREFDKATMCYLCHKAFTDYPTMKKVRDHDHLTGKYRGAAHSHCNIQMRKMYKIPVFFHNFRGYDCHLVVQSVNKFPDRKISVIGTGMEKYLGMRWGDHIEFKDSLQFLSCSLAQLAENLLKGGKEKFVHLLKEFQGRPVDLLLRKGVYPYDYMDTPARFNETKLPPKEAFYSRLRDCEITDEDYQHAQKVWKAFGCTRFMDYHDLYLKSMFHLYSS